MIRELDPAVASELLYEWRLWARPSQVAPTGPWLIWLLLAGRGFGKTRVGAEFIRERVRKGARHIIIAGATTGDVRDILVEGESGILNISPPNECPKYEPSKARLTWPNGAKALLLGAEEPDRFRGRQSDTFFADELAAWRYPEAWDHLVLGFRLGSNYNVRPQGVVSTTPRPTPIIRSLVKDAIPQPGVLPRVRITRGSTFENEANLTPEFLEQIRAKYEGTRLGRQELHAEILDDVEGALWSHDVIDRLRVPVAPETFRRVVVAIDPAVTANEKSDETGIIVAGIGPAGHAYVLADLSGRWSPNEWARRAVKAYHDFGADRIIAERNNGGQLVEANIRTVAPLISYKAVHASQGKRTRAEPIAALYEQGRVHHVGAFGQLEDQMCTWEALTGAKSPDRLDALVWALTELQLERVVRRDFSNFTAY